MKFRYLKISNLIWGTNALTREDLVSLRDGRYDEIIDLENGTYFDADDNEWKEIKGDA